MKTNSIKKITVAALLSAIGIMIPLISPIKIVLEPASFTLASHVPIFMAMFISPVTALAVTIVTAIGFAFGGFPLPIVLRAVSHLLFVAIGSWYLRKNPDITASPLKVRIFSFLIGMIHSLAEVMVISFLYFGNSMNENYYQSGFIYSVIVLVGIGGLIHSLIDFEVAFFLSKALSKDKSIAALFANLRQSKPLEKATSV